MQEKQNSEQSQINAGDQTPGPIDFDAANMQGYDPVVEPQPKVSKLERAERLTSDEERREKDLATRVAELEAAVNSLVNCMAICDERIQRVESFHHTMGI